MKQRKPLKRTWIRRNRREGPNIEKPSREWSSEFRSIRHPVASTAVMVRCDDVVRAQPKDEAYRDPALLDMAQGRPCLLLVPGCCNHRIDTTVACHENQGKGMGIKQPDDRSVWGCAACHAWYDRSGAPRETKRAVFDAAHPRQVLAWSVVAADPSEPARFRRAAQRALERLEATCST